MHDFRGAILASLKQFSQGQCNTEGQSKAAPLSQSNGLGGAGELPKFGVSGLDRDLEPAHFVETRKVSDC